MPLSGRELDAARIRDPLLRQAYTHCAWLLRRSGHPPPPWRSSLPPAKRPHWDAMIAFCRCADDLTDDPGVGPGERLRRLDSFEQELRRSLDGHPFRDRRATRSRRSQALVCRAFAHFVREWRIPEDSIWEASRALRADMAVRDYDTVASLERHMHGVSGQPAIWLGALLEPVDDRARDAAIAWSYGMQTLDFVLDVEEDLRLDKLYLPLEELRQCGLVREDVEEAVAARRMSEPLRGLMGLQTDRARRYLAAAEQWEFLVRPRGRELVRRSLAQGRMMIDSIARTGNDLFALAGPNP